MSPSLLFPHVSPLVYFPHYSINSVLADITHSEYSYRMKKKPGNGNLLFKPTSKSSALKSVFIFC